jgi:DNA polymerase-3 subunit epsilon
MKTVFYDLETTGTDFAKSAVVQIGAIMDVDGEEVDNINLKIRPHSGANIDQGALDTIGMTIEELMEDPERLSPKKAYWEFIKFCGFVPGQRVYPSSRIHRAGYNILAFDNPMLQALGERAGDNYCFAKFHWPGIDVASLACAGLRNTRATMKDFKLMTVAAAVGIDTSGKAHDALFDVSVTRELYYTILKGRL